MRSRYAREGVHLASPSRAKQGHDAWTATLRLTSAPCDDRFACAHGCFKAACARGSTNARAALGTNAVRLLSTGKQCKSLLLGCGMLVTCLAYAGRRAVAVAQAADRARWCFAPLAVSAMHRVTTDSTRRQTPTSKRAPSRHHRHQ